MIKVDKAEIFNFDGALRGMRYGRYTVYEDGTIIGIRGKPMKGRIDRNGYREVIIENKARLLHRIILSCFNPRDDMDNMQVNHKDGDKLNNHIKNLEWCTRSENIKHSYENKLQISVGNRYGKYKVLDKYDIDKIIILHKQGFKDADIAKVIGCSRELVGRKIRKEGLR